MDFLKGDGLEINSNYNFWRYSEVLELNKHAVNTMRAEFVIEDGELMVKETALSKQRKNISVYNEVERLNKHPSIFINYLKVMAEGKGIKFQIQQNSDQEGKAKKKKKTKKQAKIEQILTAKDLSNEEYEELSLKKKMGKTTTEENLQVEKRFWQQFFSTSELKEDILLNFVYGENPFRNSLSLIDLEDNLRTEKQIEKVKLVNHLLELLGFSSPRDETQLKKETVRENFAEKVVNDPLFKQQKQLNALFDLEKAYNIHGSMTPQQIRMWINSLLKPFSFQIRAREKFYQLEIQNELMSLIERKNKSGRIYKDSKNLLNQIIPKRMQEDLFEDEPTGEEKPKKKKQYNTTKLDEGINSEEE